jgi:hypothetical protein
MSGITIIDGRAHPDRQHIVDELARAYSDAGGQNHEAACSIANADSLFLHDPGEKEFSCVFEDFGGCGS